MTLVNVFLGWEDLFHKPDPEHPLHYASQKTLFQNSNRFPLQKQSKLDYMSFALPHNL